MNNRGEIKSVGLVLSVFITIIVGLALLLSIADGVGESTSLGTIANASFTMPANASATNLEGKSVSSVVVLNSSDNHTITSGNYTVTNNQVVDGVLTARFETRNVLYAGNATYISYTYQPTGYITSSGGRSIATIIILLTALGIGVVAIVPALRGKLFDIIGR